MTTLKMAKNPGDCAQRALDQGNGIVRLAPAWVPRSFCIHGRRIKLHPDDYYALGAERGGIDERIWNEHKRWPLYPSNPDLKPGSL